MLTRVVHVLHAEREIASLKAVIMTALKKYTPGHAKCTCSGCPSPTSCAIPCTCIPPLYQKIPPTKQTRAAPTAHSHAIPHACNACVQTHHHALALDLNPARVLEICLPLGPDKQVAGVSADVDAAGGAGGLHAAGCVHGVPCMEGMPCGSHVGREPEPCKQCALRHVLWSMIRMACLTLEVFQPVSCSGRHQQAGWCSKAVCWVTQTPSSVVCEQYRCNNIGAGTRPHRA